MAELSSAAEAESVRAPRRPSRRRRPGPPSAGHLSLLAPSGFTLVELLVVMGIVGTLATMFIPSLVAARDAALRVRCADNLRHIHRGMTLYLQANQDIYPCAQDPVSTSPSYWLWMGRGWRRFIAPYLGESAGRTRASALFCQGDPAREDYDATSYAYSMAFYHSPEQIDGMNSPADTYKGPKPCVRQVSSAVAQPERKVLVGEWTSNHPPVAADNGWWCWDGRRTYLFAGGAVRSLDARQLLPARDGLPNPNLTIHGIRGRDQ